MNFECLEISFCLLSFYWNAHIFLPLSWNKVMNSFFVTFWQKKWFFCNCLSFFFFWFFKIYADVRIVCQSVNVYIQCVLWIWIVNFIDAWTVFWKQSRLKIILTNILAFNIVFNKLSFYITWAADFFKCRGQFKLRIKWNLFSQYIRAKNIIRMN